MTKLTEEKFQEQVDQVIKIVNDNHERYVKEQQLFAENNNSFNSLKKKILSRITGYQNEKITKKHIVQFVNLNEEKLNIKKSDGTSIGVMFLAHNFKEKVTSQIQLVDNKPVFLIYRGNEVYLNENILEGRRMTHFLQGDTLKEVTTMFKESRPMINKTKEIYELVESKQYSVLDNYITDCMVKILENDGLNLSPVDINNLHTQLQVQYREIQRTKMEIATSGEVTESHREMLKKLDNLYMVICTTLINMGLSELPSLEEEKIARG